MSDTVFQNEKSQGESKGSVRQGNTIKSVEGSISFSIPQAWVKWYEENEANPNLHLSPQQLALVKDAEGEWDKEFSVIVNAIMPFESCIAHTGSEGWGTRSLAFSDLQVRTYILAAMPAEIEENACVKSVSAASQIQDMVASCRVEQDGAWHRILTEYVRTYDDYSAKASIDVRIKRLGNRTVAFAFMYTDHTDHSGTIDRMLESVRDK